MKTRWLAGVALLAFLSAVHTSCLEPEPVIVRNLVIPCEQDCDCYTGENYYLGTECVEGICQCPPQYKDMYKFPCCDKTRPIDDCRRQCRPLEQCLVDEVDEQYLPPGTVWPPIEEDGGAGGSGGTPASSSSSSGG